MSRHAVWHRLGRVLSMALTIALRNGTITSLQIKRIAAGHSRPAWRIAAHWVQRGWFETTDRQGVYRPTRKAIERMAEMEHADIGGFKPMGQSIRLVHEMLSRRGAASSAMISECLGISRESGRTLGYRWAKRGLLRRTHRDTYRLPIVDDEVDMFYAKPAHGHLRDHRVAQRRAADSNREIFSEKPIVHGHNCGAAEASKQASGRAPDAHDASFRVSDKTERGVSARRSG